MGQGFSERAFIDHYNFRHLTTYDGSRRKPRAEIRGDAERIQANCRQAAALGMNSYVVFCRIFEDLLPYDSVPSLWREDSPEMEEARFLRGLVREVLDFGNALGLEMVFHTNQFQFPDRVYERFGEEMAGTAPVCPGKPKVWELFRGKIDWFLREFPSCAAFQLTTSETQVSMFDCNCETCSGMDRTERSLTMVREAADVCRKHGKNLQIRTWGRIKDPQTYPDFASRLPKGVTVSTKNTAGDFHLGSPFNELVGLGAAPQIVEFDAWREYTHWNHFPCYMGDIFAERLRQCAARDVYGVACRLNWNPGEDEIFGVPFGNVANVRVFSALANDPWVNPDDVLLDWIRETFPKGNAAALFRFYKNTLRVQRASLYFLGEHAASHSSTFYNLGSPDYQARMDRLMGNEILARAVRRPALLDLRAQHQQRVWEDTFRDLEALKDNMPGEWHAELVRRGLNLRSLARVNTLCLRAYVDMCASEGAPFSLDTLEKDLEIELSAWRERDEEDYARRKGNVAREIVGEAKAKVGGNG